MLREERYEFVRQVDRALRLVLRRPDQNGDPADGFHEVLTRRDVSQLCALDLTGDTPTATGFATGIANPVDLAVAADGSLYYLARGSNAVFRVQFSTPTAVRLHAFTARRTLTGTLLTWRAATAGRTMLGFHVYREQAGKRVRLSRTLLAASNASFGRHAFVDRNAPAQVRARYWLALLLADGSRSWHGPVAASG